MKKEKDNHKHNNTTETSEEAFYQACAKLWVEISKKKGNTTNVELDFIYEFSRTQWAQKRLLSGLDDLAKDMINNRMNNQMEDRYGKYKD
jgi:hypothetical protein